MRPRLTLLGIVLTLSVLLLAPKCPTTPVPAPTPTPEPAPTPTPDPAPITCANLDCVPGQCCVETADGPKCGPCAPPSACPKPLADGAYTYVVAGYYGQGVQATPRVYGDPEFCQAIHGVWTRDCHLEGWPQRAACEMELLGGCPVWQWAPSANGPWQQAHQASHPTLSADHWGDPVYRDDPQTPTTGDTLATLQGFEGQPLACGLQRDEAGEPMAGFFVIAHGAAWVRACKADGTRCETSVQVDH